MEVVRRSVLGPYIIWSKSYNQTSRYIVGDVDGNTASDGTSATDTDVDIDISSLSGWDGDTSSAGEMECDDGVTEETDSDDLYH